MIAIAVRRCGLAPVILLVVASLLLSSTAAFADDATETPKRPTGLTVAAKPKTLAYTVTWSALDGATHYKVRWRKRGAGFVPGDEMSVEATSASFSVSQAGEWVVRLEGCNAVGCGPGISQMVATTPSRPANLAVRSTPGSLNLSATWDVAPGASSYKLRWRRPDGNFLAGDEAVVTVANASFSVSGYGWWVVRVEGCNATGCGLGVNAATAIIPARPTNFAVRFTPGSLNLTATWDSTPGVTAYTLRWRQAGESFLSGNESVVTTNSAEFSVSGAGQWVVRLEGCTGTDCGLSVSQTIAIVPPRPTNLVVNAPPEGLSLTATWDAAAGASSYKLRWRRPDENFLAGNELVTTTATTSTLTVSGAGQWVVRLEGCDDVGCGPGASVTVAVTAPRPAVWPSVCDRTPQVRDALIHQVYLASWPPKKKSCDKITAADLRRVYSLSLRNDGATSLKTGDFANVPNLGALSLADNALTTLPADIFDGLSRLGTLDLERNALTSLPEDVFDGLARLQYLHLAGNALTALPADVFDGLARLWTLGLADNALSALPADVFDGLSRLWTLGLANNDLTALPEDVFDGLADLTTLNLDNNDLTTLPEGVFGDLSELGYLYLSGNALDTLPAGAFDGLSSMKFLYLAGGDLTTLPEDVFDGLPSDLQHLFLNDNALTALPEDVFAGFSGLANLRLKGNALSALPEDLFDDLSGLISLDLASNALTSLPADVFDGMTSLGSLDLGDNALTTLPEGVFDNLDRLRRLILTGNPGTPFAVDVGSGVEVVQ